MIIFIVLKKNSVIIYGINNYHNNKADLMLLIFIAN
jgi:hypothetical protein